MKHEYPYNRTNIIIGSVKGVPVLFPRDVFHNPRLQTSPLHRTKKTLIPVWSGFHPIRPLARHYTCLNMFDHPACVQNCSSELSTLLAERMTQLLAPSERRPVSSPPYRERKKLALAQTVRPELVVRIFLGREQVWIKNKYIGQKIQHHQRWRYRLPRGLNQWTANRTRRRMFTRWRRLLICEQRRWAYGGQNVGKRGGRIAPCHSRNVLCGQTLEGGVKMPRQLLRMVTACVEAAARARPTCYHTLPSILFTHSYRFNFSPDAAILYLLVGHLAQVRVRVSVRACALRVASSQELAESSSPATAVAAFWVSAKHFIGSFSPWKPLPWMLLFVYTIRGPINHICSHSLFSSTRCPLTA